MSFKPAQRKNSKLRLALSGTSGAGKTFTMLQIAKLLCPPGKVPAVIDSERGSSEKYARKSNTPEAPGNWDFLHTNLDERSPQDYLAKLREAGEAGFPVLGIDSYSHSWIGALETVDKMGGSKFTNGWKVVSPQVTKLVDAILSYPGHVIATMRSKSDYAIEEINGKKVPRKVGMGTVSREGTDYEFDVMLDLTPEGTLSVTKTRCSALTGGVFDRDEIPKIVEKLKAWLDEGAPLTPFEEMMNRIRTATSEEDLKALNKPLRALLATVTPGEVAELQAAYFARKQSFTA